MFREAVILTWTLTIIARSGHGQLIRQVPIYQGVIQGVHDYFNSHGIVLLHTIANPIESQGLKESIAFQKLHAYFSKRHIQTASMDLYTFQMSIGSDYLKKQRPLLVLLNDCDDVKYGLAKIAGQIDMSYAKWLIFFREETAINDFFKDIYVPFDCMFMVAKNHGNETREIITEVYQVDRGDQIRHATFGTWDPESGTTTPTSGLYERRNDLFGRKIRAAAMHSPPVSLIVRDDDGKIIGIDGFIGIIMRFLESTMNCTFTYHEVETTGQRLEDGTWTGAIGSVMRNDADVIAAMLTITSARLEVVEFTTPIDSTKSRAYIKRSSSSIKWKVYIAPFSSGIWSLIGVSIVITSVMISLVKLIALANMKDAKNSPSKCAEIFFVVFGAFCCQGIQHSSLDSIRIIHLAIHLSSVIVLAAYSAALISSLTTPSFEMPFTTMAGLLQDGTYKFGMVRDSAEFSFFQETTDQFIRRFLDVMLTDDSNFPKNHYDGLRRVCNEDKYAFLTMDAAVSLLKSKVDCILDPLDTLMEVSVALALSPGSSYTGIFSRNILLLRNSGLLRHTLNPNHFSLDANNDESSWSTVEMVNMWPLLSLVIFGIFFSLLTFASEHLAYHRETTLYSRKKIMKKSNVIPRTYLRMHNGVLINLSRT